MVTDFVALPSTLRRMRCPCPVKGPSQSLPLPAVPTFSTALHARLSCPPCWELGTLRRPVTTDRSNLGSRTISLSIFFFSPPCQPVPVNRPVHQLIPLGPWFQRRCLQ